jgi:hypothetical protein
MIATAMIASVRAQTACRGRWFEPHGDRPWFPYAGVCRGADPHIGGGVKTVASSSYA